MQGPGPTNLQSKIVLVKTKPSQLTFKFKTPVSFFSYNGRHSASPVILKLIVQSNLLPVRNPLSKLDEVNGNTLLLVIIYTDLNKQIQIKQL